MTSSVSYDRQHFFIFGKMRFQVAIFILFLNFSLLAGLHVPKHLKRTNVFRRLRWIFKIFSEKAYSETFFDMLGIILIPRFFRAHPFCPIGSQNSLLEMLIIEEGKLAQEPCHGSLTVRPSPFEEFLSTVSNRVSEFFVEFQKA